MDAVRTDRREGWYLCRSTFQSINLNIILFFQGSNGSGQNSGSLNGQTESSNGAEDDRFEVGSGGLNPQEIDNTAILENEYKVLPGSLYNCPAPGFYPYEGNCKEFYVCLEVLPGVLFAEQLYRWVFAIIINNKIQTIGNNNF